VGQVRIAGLRVGDLLLAVWFAIVTLERLISRWQQGYLAIDFRIYRAAAAAVLSGSDPWRVRVDGLTFAGPPPTLLAYLPFAMVPDVVGEIVMLGIAVAAAIVTVRRLRIPAFWVLFPPLAESVIVLNPDVLVVALLLSGSALAGAAVGLKVYAAIPLVAQRRWRPLAAGAVWCLLTLPLWPVFIGDLGLIGHTFAEQAVGLSAWGGPLLLPTIIALVVLRDRGAEWLAVPAVWPYTQNHYAAIALPALRDKRALAAAMSLATVSLTPLAVIAYAVWVLGASVVARLIGSGSRTRGGTYRREMAPDLVVHLGKER
jgi:hypothetical protein